MNVVYGLGACAQPEEQAAQWGGKEQVIIVGGQPYQDDAEYGDEAESMCGNAQFIRAEQGQAGEYDCEGDGPLEWQTLQELRSGQLVAGGAAPDAQQHAEQQAVTAQYHHRQGAFLQQLIEHDQQLTRYQPTACEQHDERQQQIELLLQRQTPVHEACAIFGTHEGIEEAQVSNIQHPGDSGFEVGADTAEGAAVAEHHRCQQHQQQP